MLEVLDVLLDLPVRVSLQEVLGSLSKSDLPQNKWERSDLSKGTHFYDICTKEEWRVLETFLMFADSIVCR